MLLILYIVQAICNQTLPPGTPTQQILLVLRVETLTPTWEDFVGHLSDNFKSEVRPESMIVDTLGGICSIIFLIF
jgi:hypothetical protein